MEDPEILRHHEEILGPIRRAQEDLLASHMDLSQFMPAPMPDPASMTLPRLDKEDLASDFYERVRKWIQEYESELDEDHEVGVRLVSFGQSVQFHLADMSYWNPSLIRFDGVTEEGKPIQLIQHVSQISVLLMTLPKLANEPKRVGFRAVSSEQ